VTLQVSLVVPEGEVWAGPAEMVIAKTRDGDIGVLTGHSPVLGILVEGSLVRILPEGTADGSAEGSAVVAAVHGGEVDSRAIRAALDEALQSPEATAEGDEESSDARYYRALLRAAGEPADGA
jgi:F-type H+-transporting ATPase subunit epsilon